MISRASRVRSAHQRAGAKKRCASAPYKLPLALSRGAAGSAAHRPAACATRGEGTYTLNATWYEAYGGLLPWFSLVRVRAPGPAPPGRGGGGAGRAPLRLHACWLPRRGGLD